MTEAELAKLFTGGPLCCGIHEKAVARLLEERRRLKEALIEMVYDNRPGGGAEGRARDVLRYAEEPAHE